MVTSNPSADGITEMQVMTPKDFEEACQQPVAMGTVITMVAMFPIHILGMFVLFTKLDNMFNPNRIMAHERGQAYAKRHA